MSGIPLGAQARPRAATSVMTFVSLWTLSQTIIKSGVLDFHYVLGGVESLQTAVLQKRATSRGWTSLFCRGVFVGFPIRIRIYRSILWRHDFGTCFFSPNSKLLEVGPYLFVETFATNVFRIQTTHL